MPNPKNKITDLQRNWNIAKSYLKNGPNINNILKAFKYMLDGPSKYITGLPDILPGFLLKSLMRGNLLEKQLSKAGTISTNAVKALANKSGELEGNILNKVLDFKFPTLRAIDYNKFRKAVLSELIPYQTRPASKYADYGIDRLGFESIPSPNNTFFNPTTGSFESKVVKPVTFTFESPKIPMGNPKHYDKGTLGHTRTFTSPDEPKVLNIVETQSDWALNPIGRIGYDKMSKAAPHRLYQLRKMISLQRDLGIATLPTKERVPLLTQYRDIPSWHIHYLLLNYLLRQLLENMLYAYDKGYTHMRYPTRDTAIKVEGYEPTLLFGNPEMEQYAVLLQNKIGLLEYLMAQGTNPFTYKKLSRELDKVKLEYETLKSLSTGQLFAPQEETILKKYDLFPKLFGKLFKDLLILIVTDNKGNNWFLFDVPSNMRQMELRYYNGGVL